MHKETLQEHTKSEHEDKNFKCEQCNFKAPHKESLKRHIAASHKITKTNSEPTIWDFIRKVRRDNEKNKENVKKVDEAKTIIEENEDLLSTQEMISDSRARRQQNIKLFNCEKCEYKSGSETLMKRHNEVTHDQQTGISNKIERKAYISKRLKCSLCDKKFNKKATYESHVKRIHGEKENIKPTSSICEVSSVL